MEQTGNLTNKTISGIFWKLAERLGAQIITLVVSIVLARILLPEDYGVVTIVMIAITIFNVFVTHGFGTALVQKKNSDQLDFSTVFYFGLLLSCVLYGILFLISKPIATFYKNDQIAIVLQIMGLRLPFAAVNSVQQAYVSKKMIFKKFFFSTLVGTIISGGVGIFLAYKGYGVWALVSQYLTNVVIDTILLFIIVRWHPSFCFSFSRLRVLFKYSWKLLASGLLDTFYDELRSMVIGKKYTATDLAFYDKGKQFPSLISTNVNSSISSVLLSAMSKIQDDTAKVKEATRRSIKISSYLIFPCMVGMACVAQPFVHLVLTDKWLPIVPYLQIMCFVYAFSPIHTANLEALKAKGRSDIYLILEIIKKVVGIGILFATMWFGVLWIALGMGIATLISSVINIIPNKKILNYGLKEQILDILPNILVVAVMGVPVYFMNYIPLNSYIVFPLQIITGIVIYVLASWLFKNYSFLYIKNFVKNIINSRKKKKTNEEGLAEESVAEEEILNETNDNSQNKAFINDGSSDNQNSSE